MIRPERLFLVEKNNLDSDQNIIFEGVIKEFVYQGETAFALIALSDQHSLSIRFSTDSSGSRDNMRPGESLKIGLKRSEVIIIPENSN